jgi:hypothetical protein
MSVDPGAFEFIAGNRQIAEVGDFLLRLPERLGDWKNVAG